MHNFKVDHDLFLSLSYDLLKDIQKREKKYNGVLCPLRGGFLLSYFMSKHLDIPMFYMEISSYKGRVQSEFLVKLKPELDKGDFLLCDDIYDSGNTVNKIHSLYPHVHFDTVCLVSKIKDADIFYARLVDKEQWVDFFWETM
ncbi:MAG: hypothetical protein GY754_23920 [bacterium]|nr:hypothetical protein [bacterium]